MIDYMSIRLAGNGPDYIAGLLDGQGFHARTYANYRHHDQRQRFDLIRRELATSRQRMTQAHTPAEIAYWHAYGNELAAHLRLNHQPEQRTA